jgi:hypothetical protein
MGAYSWTELRSPRSASWSTSAVRTWRTSRCPRLPGARTKGSSAPFSHRHSVAGATPSRAAAWSIVNRSSPGSAGTETLRLSRPLGLDPRLQIRGAEAQLAAAAHDAQAALVDGTPQQARRHSGGGHGILDTQRAR